jgi:hypothetical protein
MFSLALNSATGKGARLLRRRRAFPFWEWWTVPSDSTSKPETAPQIEIVPLSQRLALTLPEASALTGMKVCALRSAIWSGDLAFIRSGERARYLVRRETLEQFLRTLEQREVR